MRPASRLLTRCLLLLSTVTLSAETPTGGRPATGLPGHISNFTFEPVAPWTKAPPAVSNLDMTAMAAWALRHLTHNPRPDLNYEPNFWIRPLQTPPALPGHDAIVPGDTDVRMDWEFPYMREILGLRTAGPVERGLRARVLGYLKPDGFAWVPPGHYMEGEVYNGANVGTQEVVSTWATAKLLRSQAETYQRTGDLEARKRARAAFVALRRIADWDSGRAYYPGGSGAWLNGKWVKPQVPTALVEPLVRYWEITRDRDALDFAMSVADGLLADTELLPPANNRLQPNGEFHGHMHSTLHGVWGVAHLGAAIGNPRYLAWAKRVYDYAATFSTGTGWISAALWDDEVREVSETCATSDMVSIASWLARGGFPNYWDDVERTMRNYLAVQQFFVTPEYERLYRDINRDKPAAEVAAGLARMADFQGGFMGGPAPNDWINWIASPKQCGPYNTPYGCMGMFGCCIPEGMRALHTVWAGAIVSDTSGVLVNLALTRASPAADVRSSVPHQGRVDVVARTPGRYLLRPPSWTARAQVQLYRGARQIPVVWDGPAKAYVAIDAVRAGETLTLLFPQATWTQRVAIWPTKPDLALTIRWRGNAVVDMDPKGKGLPIDFARPRPLPPLPVQ